VEEDAFEKPCNKDIIASANKERGENYERV